MKRSMSADDLVACAFAACAVACWAGILIGALLADYAVCYKGFGALGLVALGNFMARKGLG